MARRGENIYHRKDGRWEGRYIRYRTSDGKAVYGYVYASTYSDVKQLLAKKNSINLIPCRVPLVRFPSHKLQDYGCKSRRYLLKKLLI